MAGGGLAMLGAAIIAGCGKEGMDQPSPQPSPTPDASRVVIPESVRADDPSVNDFIAQIIATCVAEDYEAFRLLWSAREKPISEKEFRRGWRATQSVTILNILKRRRREEGDIVYVVHGKMQLDPGANIAAPQRELVLLLVKEQERWHIASAPRSVAKALKASAANTNSLSDIGSSGATTEPTNP